MTISSIQSALRSCSVGISSAAEAVSKAASSCFNCCCVRQSRYSVLTNEASSLPPSNSLIKSSFIRNALGLNLSRAELADCGDYSLLTRNELINNESALLKFLARVERTLKTSENVVKKDDLTAWAGAFLKANGKTLEDNGNRSSYMSLILLKKICGVEGDYVPQLNNQASLGQA